MLVIELALSEPHAGVQVVPVAVVSVHVTPRLFKSFCSVAVKVCAGPPISSVLGVGDTETVIIAEALTVMAAVPDFVASATEVAVSVGALLGAAGTADGGVYITVVARGALNVPQAGAQVAVEPAAVRVQVTPWAFGSFVTVAVNFIGAAPGCRFAEAASTLTETGGSIVIFAIAGPDELIALMVTVAEFATEAGGVYVMPWASDVVALSVPQGFAPLAIEQLVRTQLLAGRRS